MHPAEERRYPESLARRLQEIARGADAREDAAGNVSIRKPSARGREKSPGVCVHCALPAAGEPMGPEEIARSGALLALLDDRALEHGPLEILVTRGAGRPSSGAERLDPALVSSRFLVDLSGAEEDVLFLGCAGSRETAGIWKLEREEPRAGSVGAEIRVGGLRGGDAGRDAGKGRGNAATILARALLRLQELGGRTSEIEVSARPGEIPREARAVLAFPRSLPRRAEPALKKLAEALRAELGSADPAVALRLAPLGEAPRTVFRRHVQKKILRALLALPDGVVRANPENPREAETSASLGAIATGEDALRVATVERALLASALSDLAERVEGIFILAGAKAEPGTTRPPWRADPRSPLVRAARAAYEAVAERAPEERSAYRPLECALIAERIPRLDMVSLGGPAERLRAWLVETLRRVE